LRELRGAVRVGIRKKCSKENFFDAKCLRRKKVMDVFDLGRKEVESRSVRGNQTLSATAPIDVSRLETGREFRREGASSPF